MQMDLWVVAAATGAGYLAKYWKNVLGDKEGSSGIPSGNSLPDNPDSPTLIQRTGDKTWPSHKFSRAETTDQFLDEVGKDDYSDGLFAEPSRGDGPFAMDVACVSALEHKIENDKYKEYRDDYRLNADIYDIPEYRTWEVTDKHSFRRSRKCLRSRHLQRQPLQYIKPRTSLDSCVMAQMHREHAEIEYLRAPLSSPCTPTLRPFLVTDGRQVLNRVSGDFRNDLDKEVLPKADDKVVGIPHLPQIVTTGNSKKKLSNGKNQIGKSSNVDKSIQFYSRDGSSRGHAIFCFGISIGVMTTLIANKVELENLKDCLKQSENLVEDLQEELEMKDSLTVKELVNDDDSLDILESLCAHENKNMFPNQADTAVPIIYTGEESVSLENFEAISKIEAELEAELERLELNMKGSMLHEKSSDAIELYQELDQDVSAELVQGELNADIFGGNSSSDPTPDRGSTPRLVKDGVSPLELSLRLHEVIQSRLQERIMELEVKLAKSQKRIRHLESEKSSWREVSQSESSSNLGSPIAHPLVMNLSGDALDAYNEVFGELNKLNGSRDGEDSWIQGDKLIGIENGGDRDDGSPNHFDCGDDDDDDLLLIKQIVEKARQGSPAILRAQRSLVWSKIDEK